MIYALDSNIISYIIKGDETISKKYNAELDKGNHFIIPPIVYVEVKRGLEYINSVSKLKTFEYMCSEFEIGKIDIHVLNKAVNIYVDLRKQGKLIDDSDILIAAYCIINDYTLVTNNTGHFERIKYLKYINWK
jgi:predicted nucleic acid-binding protein